jgi:hypothetical protein
MRNALVLALLCATALCACDKGGDEAKGPPPGAPPLLAGPDEGAKPGDPGYVEGYSKGQQTAADAPVSATVVGGPAAAAPAGAPGARPAGAGAPRVAAVAPDGSKALRKPGLWQITSTTSGPPPAARPGGGAPGGGRPGGFGGGGNGTLCVTAESEATRGVLTSRGGPDCVPKVGHNGSTWTLSSTCVNEFQGNSVTRSTSETLTGDLNAKYTLKTTTTTSGAPAEMAQMNATRTTTQSGTWKGACPAGQVGGDFTGADGQKRNLLQGGGGRG